MKQLIFLPAFILLVSCSWAQDRVIWAFGYDQESGLVTATADIAEGWHLYSQHINNELGPVPTSFTFEENNDIKLVGKVNEPQSIKEYDPNFEGELNFFKDSVTFSQKIRVYKATELKGYVSFMLCNDTMCLPPTDLNFNIPIE